MNHVVKYRQGKFKTERQKRYRAHARLKKKGYKVAAKQRCVFAVSFDMTDKDLIYLQSHGYNLQTEIATIAC